MNDYKVVVDKSTVPVGTADAVRNAIAQELVVRGVTTPFNVVSNPEFLKEGAAIEDFMRPGRIVLGCDDEQAALNMRALYAPFQRHHERLVLMDIRSAELTKYAANASAVCTETEALDSSACVTWMSGPEANIAVNKSSRRSCIASNRLRGSITANTAANASCASDDSAPSAKMRRHGGVVLNRRATDRT
jgi:hypothetical protein